MDARITVQSPAVTVDGQGSAVTAWSTIAQAWAQVDVLAGNESTAGNARQASASSRFIVRHTSALHLITAGWRVVCQGVAYDITAATMAPARPDAITITATLTQ